jgi:ABC-type nitrate/sulfonate/bicarbonate transport system permease component
MIDSVDSLFGEYHFISASGLTSFLVILVPILGFLCCYTTKYWASKLFLNFDMHSTLYFSFRFFSYFFLLLFMVYWFQSSPIAELVFLMLVAGLEQKIYLSGLVRKIDPSYSQTLSSLGVSEKKIIGGVYSKLTKPYVFEKLHRLFLAAWGWAFVYEYISGSFGIGNLMRKAILYNDLSTIALLVVIMIVVIYISGLVFKIIQYKVITWIPDELK